jgi:hypothetical protein
MSKKKTVLCSISYENWKWADDNDFSFSKILESAIRNNKDKISNGSFGVKK